MLNVNRGEIARYLGYRNGKTPDDKTSALIEECINEVLEVTETKSVHDTFPLSISDGKCCFAGIEVESQSLINNLHDCDEVVMLAVTIGGGFDRLVRRAEIRDMSKACVLQAVGAEVVEAWCNKVNDEITSGFATKGLHTRPRFSPGYGDFPLDKQQDFERVLHMRKNIGISLSDGNIMTPSKSITAVIGVYR